MLVEGVPAEYIAKVHYITASTEGLQLDTDDPWRGKKASSRDQVNVAKDRLIIFHRNFQKGKDHIVLGAAIAPAQKGQADARRFYTK